MPRQLIARQPPTFHCLFCRQKLIAFAAVITFVVISELWSVTNLKKPRIIMRNKNTPYDDRNSIQQEADSNETAENNVEAIITLTRSDGTNLHWTIPRRLLNPFKRLAGASNPYLSVLFQGRLGNRIFQYCALLGIAARTGRIPVIRFGDYLYLKRIFQIHAARIVPDAALNNFYIYNETASAIYDLKTNVLLSNVNITLRGYFQSWKYFHHIETMIRNELKFTPECIDAAQAVMSEIRRSVEMANVTFIVGVHVRLTDMLLPKHAQYGHTIASADYIINAMNFMKNNLTNASLGFLFVTDMPDWVNNYFGDLPNIEVISSVRFEVDFALLTLSDHLILTVGTFGWWASWQRNQGLTIYYADYPLAGSEMDGNFRAADFYPAHWIPMR